MRPWIPLSIAAVLASAGGPPAALALEDPFAGLEEPGLSGEALRERFESHLPALTGHSDHATFRDGITVCSREGDDARALRATEIARRLGAAREALTAMGFPSPEKEPEVAVVLVTVPPGAGASVALGTKALLLRAPERAAPVPVPALRNRIDGPPIARDVRDAARATVAWLAASRERARGGVGDGALRGFLAARVVADAVPAGTPAWFRAGLAARIDRVLAGDEPPAPVHLPPSLATPTAESLGTLFAGESPDPCAAAILERVVGKVLAASKDPVALAAALGEAKTPAARDAAAGLDLLAEAEAAAREVASSATTCGKEGTLPCFACGGRNRIELACGECEGTGLFSCPSCFGFDACWAGNCEKGWQLYEGGDRVRCRYCSNGTIACKACRGKKAVDCTACRGRGRTTLPCLACLRTGDLPCPDCAGAAGSAGSCGTCSGAGTAECPWCAKGGSTPCGKCRGTGFLGCRSCFGTMKSLCDACEGTGEKRMVYKDGTTASVTKCPPCGGRGWSPCRPCRNGRLACKDCDGKGLEKGKVADCPGCLGEGTLPCAACRWSPPPLPAPGGTAEDSEANAAVLQKAQTFLLTCNRSLNGGFALRERSKGKSAGRLWAPTPFSNASVLWTLLVAGVSRDNPALERPWKVLMADAGKIAGGEIPDAGVQATSFILRALLVAGHPADDPLVVGLVKRIVDAQRSSGLWNYAIDGSGDGDNILTSLIAVEALHVARTRGVKVPGTVWSKAYRAASSEFGSRGPTAAKRGGDIDAIDVVSNLALLVIAKAGSLGEESGTFDYESIPDVQAGLAWLDRHFSITDHPDFRAGARVRVTGGGAYFAYLFALQRLAMLLRIEEIGGERWHVTGSRHIRGLQREDGSFEESGAGAANWSVRSTWFAVLFLVRATTPITDPGPAR